MAAGEFTQYLNLLSTRTYNSQPYTIKRIEFLVCIELELSSLLTCVVFVAVDARSVSASS